MYLHSPFPKCNSLMDALSPVMWSAVQVYTFAVGMAVRSIGSHLHLVDEKAQSFDNTVVVVDYHFVLYSHWAHSHYYWTGQNDEAA